MIPICVAGPEPGDIREVVQNGYLRLSAVSAATAGGRRPGVAGSPPASAAVLEPAWWERLAESEHVAGVVGGLDLPEPAVVLAVVRLPPVRQFWVGDQRQRPDRRQRHRHRHRPDPRPAAEPKLTIPLTVPLNPLGSTGWLSYALSPRSMRATPDLSPARSSTHRRPRPGKGGSKDPAISRAVPSRRRRDPRRCSRLNDEAQSRQSRCAQ